MSLVGNDLITQLAFSLHQNKGVFALLLGSGLSRAAEIPTGWEITLDLVRQIAMARGVEDQADWAAWYRTAIGGEPNYSTLLQELAASPAERRSILHRYIEPDAQDREEGRKLPTPAHGAIADLVQEGYVRVIITTNFDRLMENALRERGIEPTVVASIDALQGAEPLTHSRCYLLKLHGDYKDARILNTEEELDAYDPAYDGLLDRIFDEHGLIVCGWSGEWDTALRAAFRRAPNRRYSTYWAARGALGAGAKDLISHRRAQELKIADADSFFIQLHQRVSALARTKQENPLSVEMLVASTKRFLSKPEFRIQLDELFAEETERLISRLGSPDFEGHPANEDGFKLYIDMMESAVEPLATMAGTLGRWGSEAELRIVLDAISALYVNAFTGPIRRHALFDTEMYPAVLVLHAYGLGLTRAGRWSTLRGLFHGALPTRHGRGSTIVENLFLSNWSGGRDAIWDQLFSRRYYASLSRHLENRFATWGKAFLTTNADYEMMVERFELLGSLADFGLKDQTRVNEALARNQGRGWVDVTCGRSGWNHEARRQLYLEFQGHLRPELISAGFEKDGGTVIEKFETNFDRLVAELRWR